MLLLLFEMQEKKTAGKCEKREANQAKDEPDEVPKEARSWSNRSKTDNSKSEAMGLGRGRDNGLQLPVLSTVAEQLMLLLEEEVVVVVVVVVVVEVVAETLSSASMSVCKQGPLAGGWRSHDCCCCCCCWLWLSWLLPVSCKWEGRFLTRLTATMLLDALVFEFSSSDKSVRCSGLVEAEAGIFLKIPNKKKKKKRKKEPK